MKKNLLVVLTLVAIIFMGCNDEQGTSSIQLTASGGASRTVSGVSDGSGINGLVFASMIVSAYEWSGTGQTMNTADGYQAGDITNSFYNVGGTLFDPTTTFVGSVDDAAIPETIDMITFEAYSPTVIANDESYGQSNAIGYDRNMQMEYEAMDHKAVVRVVDQSGDVISGYTAYTGADSNADYVDEFTTDGDESFNANIVAFVNPAILNNFSSPINGIVELTGDSSDPFIYNNVDGVAHADNLQNLVTELDRLLAMRECYLTIIPMNPATPWDDGAVTVTLDADFSTMLAGIWTSGDASLDAFDNGGTFQAPIYDWEDIGSTVDTVDSVVDFETDTNGSIIDWTITIE